MHTKDACTFVILGLLCWLLYSCVTPVENKFERENLTYRYQHRLPRTQGPPYAANSVPEDADDRLSATGSWFLTHPDLSKSRDGGMDDVNRTHPDLSKSRDGGKRPSKHLATKTLDNATQTKPISNINKLLILVFLAVVFS